MKYKDGINTHDQLERLIRIVRFYFTLTYIDSLKKQIKEAGDSANRVRLSTDKLANQIKQVRAGVDGDLKDTKDFINTLKDFLTG